MGQTATAATTTTTKEREKKKLVVNIFVSYIFIFNLFSIFSQKLCIPWMK